MNIPNALTPVVYLECAGCDYKVMIPAYLEIKPSITGESDIEFNTRRKDLPSKWKDYNSIMKELGFKWGSDFHNRYPFYGLICESCQELLRKEHSSGEYYKNGRKRKYV